MKIETFTFKDIQMQEMSTWCAEVKFKSSKLMFSISLFLIVSLMANPISANDDEYSINSVTISLKVKHFFSYVSLKLSKLYLYFPILKKVCIERNLWHLLTDTILSQ